MPNRKSFQSAMRVAGVMNDVPVVVYDASNSLAAARAWWLLRYFGKLDVQVLDGGFDAWVAAGHAGPGGELRLDSLRRLLRARSGESDER